MNAIETHDLTKRYGAKTAVDRLNLTVFSGECFALLGMNGAGKSTAIRMLAGLTAPTSGSASVFGHDIARDAEKARAVTAVSPQETAVAVNLTVRENLALMAGVYGLPADSADALMRDFELEKYASSRAGTLSGGWQRRLSIAMALAARPKLLFLDEPTLGLDVAARRGLWKSIEALRGGMTIVLTTHYLEEAQALADRIGIMAEGTLRALGTADELIRLSGRGTFEDAFLSLGTSEGGDRL